MDATPVTESLDSLPPEERAQVEAEMAKALQEMMGSLNPEHTTEVKQS